MNQIAGNEVRKRHTHKLGFIGAIFCSMEHNNHRPHILRGKVLFILSFIAVFLMGMSFARYYFLHQTVLGQEVVASVLIDMTNQTRIAYGESPLVRNQKLENAATMKAEDMANYQYFAHNSPTGVTPWFWIKKAGYDFLYAGENLAIDFTQSKDVADAWMKSPTHKANLLNSKFKEIGIATREGVFNGHNTIYVVQTFGTAKDIKSIESNTNIETSPTPDPIPAGSEESPNGEIAGAIVKIANNNNISNNNKIATTTITNKAERNNNSNSEVAGTATAGATHIVSPISAPEYITLIDENNMIIVADREAIANATNTEIYLNNFSNIENGEYIKYSNFWQKFIYNFWFNLNYIYKILVVVIMFSLTLFFFTEFKKHHWLHMLYGVITIVLLLLLFYINQSLW